MKYISYLFILSIIFSLGMYVGMDRSGQTSSVQKEEIEKDMSVEEDGPKEDGSEETNREQIIEELNTSHLLMESAEPTPLQEIAYKGEQIVKKTFDQIIQVTYTFVEGIF